VKTFAGRKLGRPTGHRIALLRNMASQLLHHEKIQTSIPKAKEVSRFAEKLITAAKSEGVNARRKVAQDLHQKAVQEKLFEVLVPRYKTRQGGYTQIIRTGPRLSDGTEMGILKLVS
jgi:large subunit ribosomal protein L17